MLGRHWKGFRLLEYLVPWLVLPLLLLYTYLELFHAPYLGFAFSPSSGQVQELFVNPPESTLQVGDRIVAVDSVAWDAEDEMSRNSLLSHVSPGDVLTLQIDRNGTIYSLKWLVPGFSTAEFWNRLLNAWILGYIFWLAGIATILFVHPRDSRTRLFIAFFLLTAIWLVVGNTSRWNLWESDKVFRMAIWLAVPVYLHLHWLFPQSLGPLPHRFWYIVYAVSLVMAICEWFMVLPRSAYIFAFMAALVGSALLLIVHYLRQPDERNHIRLLTFAYFFVAIPLVGLVMVIALRQVPPMALIALGTLPIIPGAYFYAIYRFQLGGLEFRANRLLALYLFLILIVSVSSVFFALVSLLPNWLGKDILAGVILTLSATLLGIYLFPLFQRSVEIHLLGITLPSAGLLETYAARITTSLTQRDLARLLQEEILPSLLIRQSALLMVENRRFTPLYMVEIDASALPREQAMVGEIERMDLYFPAPYSTATPATQGLLHQYAWIRVGIPIRFEERLVGVWLFGRHDPDDGYNSTELVMLQTLAHQTAIALVNIEQSQQLQALYEANIDRHELERTHLAHLLHDDILGGLSMLKANLESSCLTERFEKTYQVVKQRVMHMITGLRPAMLNYGLHAALEELTDDLNERVGSEMFVQLDVEQGFVELPTKLEEQLFRIIQQAIENALRHSQATIIRITGTISAEAVDLTVVDNGIGFDITEGLSIGYLLANQHFGLVGMYERAAIAQSKLLIDSAPNQGTRVRVVWAAESSRGSLQTLSEDPH